MAATFDAKNTVKGAAGLSTYSLTHTPVGTPTLALAWVMGLIAGGPGAVTVTYGGQAMTELAGLSANTASPFLKLFYKLNPLSGAQSVVATFTNNVTNGGMMSQTFLGSTLPPDNLSFNAATLSVDTRTVANTDTDDQTAEGVVASGKTNFTPNNGQTEDMDILTTNASADASIGGYHRTGVSASTTLGVTNTLAGAVAIAHGAVRIPADPIGAGAATNAADSLASAALVAVGAAGAATNAADTVASAALVDVTAAGSVTNAADTLAATAAVSSGEVTGNGAITEAADSLAAAAQVDVQAAGAASHANDTLASAAQVSVQAAASVTEGQDTLSAGATTAVSAAGAIADGADSLAGVAQVSIAGIGSFSNADDTLAGDAHVGAIVLGDAIIIEAGDMLSATATVTTPDLPLPPPLQIITGTAAYFRQLWRRRSEAEEQRQREALEARQAAFHAMLQQQLDASEKAIEEDDLEVLALM